ncbi:hypothetical protein HA402_010144 [Bradysia odoriphaga]|nr:hypothetical protein HA402_010144 [Bradysia odoriphaga]
MQDPNARVAAETLCNTGLVVLAGEITTTANVDYIQVARDTIRSIGYDNTEYGIDYKGCAVLVAYDKQSPDIAQGVDRSSEDYLNQGAGDQGLMFGYACDETPDLMPAPIWYAHRLVQRQSELRKDGRLPWLRPDAKSQVTFRYVDGRPVEVDTVVLSTQHAPEVSQSTIHEAAKRPARGVLRFYGMMASGMGTTRADRALWRFGLETNHPKIFERQQHQARLRSAACSRKLFGKIVIKIALAGYHTVNALATS